MKRVIMHWTGGGYRASKTDKRHYHEIVESDGTRVLGDFLPEANLKIKSGKYAAHTRKMNTGSIGLAMAAMRDAVEVPYKEGQNPITRKQFDAFCAMVAEYCDTYGIKVTRKTVLTHAEVQETLGVWQRAKWDITILPSLNAPCDAIEVGDAIRKRVKIELQKMQKPRRRWFWQRRAA